MLIKIPNTAFIIEGDKKLSPDETILFAILFKYRNSDSQLLFSIDLLSSIMKFKNGNDRKNKAYIREILLSLKNKEYINCDINEQTNYDSAINGTIINPEKDYSGVEGDIFNEIITDDINKSRLKLYIYADINRFANGNRASFNTFSLKLNYYNSKKNHSVRVVKDIVEEMDGKFIFRFSGNRIENSPEQECNLYYSMQHMTPELKIEYSQHVREKESKKQLKRKDDEKIKLDFLGFETVSELRETLKNSNWHKKDQYGMYAKIEPFDYWIYRIAKDEHVEITKIKRIEAVIETMKNNPDCPYDFDAWEREYMQDKEKIEKWTREEK